MPIDVGGVLQSLGLNVGAIETKATDFLLKRAAEWARVPTRIRRVQSAIHIVGSAATQQNRLDLVGEMTVAAQAISRIQQIYDAASGDVADVMEVVRTLPVGHLPPVSLVPKAAKAAGAVTSVLQALPPIERGVKSAATKVLTPEQAQQLMSGLSFPSFMATQGKKLLLYAVFALPLYYVVTGKARGTRKW